MDLASIGPLPEAVRLTRVLSRRIGDDETDGRLQSSSSKALNAVSAFSELIRITRDLDAIPEAAEVLTNLQNKLNADPTQTSNQIPYLTGAEMKEAASVLSKDPRLVVGGIIYECRDVLSNIRLGSLSLSVLTATMRYAAGGQTPSDLAVQAWNFESLLRELNQRSETQLKTHLDLYEAAVVEQKSAAEAFLKSQTEQLVAFKKSLSEEIKLGSATKLWSDRAISHRVMTGSALVSFVVVIGLCLWNIFSHFAELVAMLPRDKDLHIEYVSIALLAIPAIGIGWVLKVLTRFVQTNSVLGDDARQRQAMIRTYLALVAEKESGVTEKDRLVMLNAIFRPLPGGQADELAPPTILDLIKKEP